MFEKIFIFLLFLEIRFVIIFTNEDFVRITGKVNLIKPKGFGLQTDESSLGITFFQTETHSL